MSHCFVGVLGGCAAGTGREGYWIVVPASRILAGRPRPNGWQRDGLLATGMAAEPKQRGLLRGKKGWYSNSSVKAKKKVKRVFYSFNACRFI